MAKKSVDGPCDQSIERDDGDRSGRGGCASRKQRRAARGGNTSVQDPSASASSTATSSAPREDFGESRQATAACGTNEGVMPECGDSEAPERDAPASAAVASADALVSDVVTSSMVHCIATVLGSTRAVPREVAGVLAASMAPQIRQVCQDAAYTANMPTRAGGTPGAEPAGPHRGAGVDGGVGPATSTECAAPSTPDVAFLTSSTPPVSWKIDRVLRVCCKS